MAQRRSRQNSSRLSESATDNQIVGRESRALIPMEGPKRSSYMMMTLLVMVMYSTWSVYYHQYQSLPTPLSAEQAGKRGFSELEALKHVEALSGLGPHPVGSDALAFAFQYVKTIAEKIQNASHWEVDVELDIFHVNAGANRLYRGLFMGKTLIYADMDHIVLRISPKYTPEAREQAILVSSHIDSVFSGGGAGDCSSCVAVMLEVARAMSQWAHGFKNSVIFLFNTGEEEGLNGAHSFVTQHLWSDTIRVAVDLEAMGIGGKSGVFQTGPDPWAVQNFALVAKYPSGQILAQDIFTSGAIKSATDFQVYMEYAGLSGLDFAYTDNTAVYHTKNDKLNLLTAGSLQHLGENMIAFLLHSASSTIPGRKDTDKEGTAEKDLAIYFDILGMYMVVYQQKFGSMLYNSVIMQSLLIWALSLLMGGVHAAVSLALSCLSLLLMWIFSLSSSIFVAFLLPLVSASSVPYVASPWLVVGLFGAPALLGALSGQHIGFRILKAYLFNAQTKKSNPNLSLPILANLAELEAERWLFKSGLVQCLLLLILANYYKIGTAYLPLIWLVSPAFAYGLLEATLSPVRLPKPLKIATLVIGYSVPILVSGGSVVRVMGILIGTLVRIDRNPGGTPEWLGNIVVSVLVAAVICLMLVYLLSYVHLSGGKRSIVGAGFVLFGLSVTSLWAGFVPPYTEDFARALNVVHVVETTGSNINRQDPIAYVSLSSSTPGKLTQEVELVGEGFVCNNMTTDFVSFSVKYGCRTYDDAESGWSKMDLPSLQVEGDEGVDGRVTKVSVDTKSSKRWCLAVNMREVEDFEFEGDYEELAVPLGYKGSIDGWHQIQFSGGKKAPTKFTLTLHWARNSSQDSSKGIGGDQHPLLKLRTDVDRLTPKVENVMKKLPPWSASFGKSTSPFNLAFLTNLPVEF